MEKKYIFPCPDIALLHTYYIFICVYIIYRYKQTSVYFDQYKIMLTRLVGIYAITQRVLLKQKNCSLANKSVDVAT